METQVRNALESVALFEEKVPITPRDLADDTIDIDGKLYGKLKSKLEGKCSVHGWVVPSSLKVLSRSMGYVESGRFTGDIVYHIQVQGNVINPPSGAIVTGQVIRKNKMGMYVEYKNAIRIILPRDLHIGNAKYEEILVGQYVECEIKKSRFQVNDEFILSVGDFRGLSTSDVRVKFVQPPPFETAKERVEETVEETVEDTVEEEAEEEEVDATATTEPLMNELVSAVVGGATVAIDPVYFSSKSPQFSEFSNFYASKMLVDGKEWPTNEHYFQSQKFPSTPEYQETIRAASSAAKAKSLGASNEHPIRIDWDDYRVDVMKKGLKAKFDQNVGLQKILSNTGTRPLIEDTNDPFWGQGLNRNKRGKNRLGLLLMELRDGGAAKQVA